MTPSTTIAVRVLPPVAPSLSPPQPRGAFAGLEKAVNRAAAAKLAIEQGFRPPRHLKGKP